MIEIFNKKCSLIKRTDYQKLETLETGNGGKGKLEISNSLPLFLIFVAQE